MMATWNDNAITEYQAGTCLSTSSCGLQERPWAAASADPLHSKTRQSSRHVVECDCTDCGKTGKAGRRGVVCGSTADWKANDGISEALSLNRSGYTPLTAKQRYCSAIYRTRTARICVVG